MKNILIASVVAIPLLFGGCSTLNTNNLVSQIQAAAQDACNLLPTVSTVISFINSAAGQSVQTIGAEICAFFVTAVPVPPAASVRARAALRVGTTYVCVPGTTYCGWRT